ncbi:MAG: hypothetical protein AB7K52_06500 [Phycisphaerales bacterium]
MRLLAWTGLLLVAAFSGCRGTRPNHAPASVEEAGESRTSATAGGTYYVTCAPIPDPIPANEMFDLDVRVFADRGMTRPADDIAIIADADMPAHRHGMNLVPRSRRIGAGHFRVSGMLFHMPGRWEIVIEVRSLAPASAGSTARERARFEVLVP